LTLRPDRPTDRPSSSSDPAREPIASDGLIGESAALAATKRYTLKIASANSNVLITGETGTGKECIAQLIHANSARRHRPFVCVNSAAIPDTLLESELFGFERGAFTGAYTRYAGRLAQADKGTIFFDEIGEMSLQAQAKLLRALESKEVVHLGGTRASVVDIRVIAATNRDLDALAMTGGFRSDLYFRLNVARVHLPPLRERKGDIPLLVDHFVREYAKESGVTLRGWSDEVMRTLLAYDWPGNIRELKNIVEATMINRPVGVVEMDDLPPVFRSRLPSPHAALSESDRLLLALVSSHWNKTKAAHALGCSRMTVYRRLAKYRIAQAADHGSVRRDR